MVAPPTAPAAWTLAASTVRSYTPSARLPPMTGAPENETTQVALAADGSACGFVTDTTVPSPAPSRPVTATAPGSSVTGPANVIVSPVTIDRWAVTTLPSVTTT